MTRIIWCSLLRSRVFAAVAVWGLSAATADRAAAGYVHSYANGFVNASPGTADGSANYSNALTAEGSLTLSSGLIYANDGSANPNNSNAPPGTYAEGQIFGAVGLSANRLFSLSAYSYGYDNDRYYDAGADAGISLGFRDIIRYSGANPPPVLSLTFRADGFMSFTPYNESTANGTSGVEFGYSFANFNTLSGYLPGPGNPPQTRTNIGWPAAATPTQKDVDITFSYDANYDAAIGGYAFNLNVYTTTSVFAYNRSGSANSDFLNTVALTTITRGDGQALDPALLTFDSGLTFGPPVTATPAPPGLVLLLSGAVTFGFGAVARRVRGRRAALSGLVPSTSDPV